MPDTKNRRLPRLGDRKDLVIEIMISAVHSYRQTYIVAFASSHSSFTRRKKTMTEAEAREELEDLLPDGFVCFSAGDTMQVRVRSRRLGVDVQADCTRLSPTHVRCSMAQCRRLDTSTTETGSRASNAEYATRKVYDVHGRAMGFLRRPRAGGALEYRPTAEESGALPPPWVPLPEHVRALLIQGTKNAGARAWAGL